MLGIITDVVRSVVAPAALVADQAKTAIVEAQNPAGLYERLPASTHGTLRVFRAPSSRQVPDLAEITRIFKAHGLAPCR